MKVLVACEFSGIVRNELTKQGHDAYSCDLIPSETPGKHLQQDVIPILNNGWDMIIAFPPCTDIATCGARWFPAKIKDGRQQKAINFFMTIANANCNKIAIENPQGIMNTKWRPPDQYIQPYEFGDPYSKRTCLWLKGLPKLIPTSIIEQEPRIKYKSGRSLPKWYAESYKLSADERQKTRSKTFMGIANAMATQWGNIK